MLSGHVDLMIDEVMFCSVMFYDPGDCESNTIFNWLLLLLLLLLLCSSSSSSRNMTRPRYVITLNYLDHKRLLFTFCVLNMFDVWSTYP